MGGFVRYIQFVVCISLTPKIFALSALRVFGLKFFASWEGHLTFKTKCQEDAVTEFKLLAKIIGPC